eukprot:TRINITY_DN52784_c0_g1_i1.p1 TRINITY_DN52784_c0_g1~~TRINITY_DN52784_c0_g1_i1.p1  ORF type:complete len:175 (+),score=45.41 TRINITY_DN52784_c0_g1_i1:99-623(+)
MDKAAAGAAPELAALVQSGRFFLNKAKVEMDLCMERQQDILSATRRPAEPVDSGSAVFNTLWTTHSDRLAELRDRDRADWDLEGHWCGRSKRREFECARQAYTDDSWTVLQAQVAAGGTALCQAAAVLDAAHSMQLDRMREYEERRQQQEAAIAELLALPHPRAGQAAELSLAE